ncbi:hypothetical protein NU688_19755 [Variovorax sp. ZS18.2.2]|uniref:hypothetical protein n=1 Tax=Variovorax sp. ZS18.2.2 TaxID=2971255 RepID=UPI002151F9B3|nr:hypothetical protein [Variovorax sp. ZS18.2.2]MCR6478406.1 hypothetical protein [Variovorax sp. ZS18.2.2]
MSFAACTTPAWRAGAASWAKAGEVAIADAKRSKAVQRLERLNLHDDLVSYVHFAARFDTSSIPAQT